MFGFLRAIELLVGPMSLGVNTWVCNHVANAPSNEVVKMRGLWKLAIQ
jgi:hypothetical protein